MCNFSTGRPLKGLVIAIKLNGLTYVQEALERTPAEDIPFVVGSLPSHYVPSLLNFLVELVRDFTISPFFCY